MAAKKLGIWLDHASAHLMEFASDVIETKIIESKFTHQEKEHSLSKGESQMHQKEQQLQGDYYKKLGEIIKNYESVLLFGPTDAKVELYNLLQADHHFDKINMVVRQTDKMTTNQEHAFVKDHFRPSSTHS